MKRFAPQGTRAIHIPASLSALLLVLACPTACGDKDYDTPDNMPRRTPVAPSADPAGAESESPDFEPVRQEDELRGSQDPFGNQTTSPSSQPSASQADSTPVRTSLSKSQVLVTVDLEGGSDSRTAPQVVKIGSNQTPSSGDSVSSSGTSAQQPSSATEATTNLDLPAASLRVTETLSSNMIRRPQILILAAVDTSEGTQSLLNFALPELGNLGAAALASSPPSRMRIIGKSQDSEGSFAVNLRIPSTLSSNTLQFKQVSRWIHSCNALGGLSEELVTAQKSGQSFDHVHLISLTTDNAGPGNNDPKFCLGPDPQSQDHPASLTSTAFLETMTSVQKDLSPRFSYHSAQYTGVVSERCATFSGRPSGTALEEFTTTFDGPWRVGREYQALKILFPWMAHVELDACSSQWATTWAPTKAAIDKSLRGHFFLLSKPARSLESITVGQVPLDLTKAELRGQQVWFQGSMPSGTVTVTYQTSSN